MFFSGSEGGVKYFAELLKEKKDLAMFPLLFPNVGRILENEIGRVRAQSFQSDFLQGEVALPKAVGKSVILTAKLYVPKNDYPDHNLVGRILGPRGATAKQLEQETGCKIMVRGRGLLRDRIKEDSNLGKPNWEHLDDELHVLIKCEDTENRARIKMSNASKIVGKLLTPPAGTDDFKRKQLMEMGIINGTYKAGTSRSTYNIPNGLANIKHLDTNSAARQMQPLALVKRLPAGGYIFPELKKKDDEDLSHVKVLLDTSARTQTAWPRAKMGSDLAKLRGLMQDIQQNPILEDMVQNAMATIKKFANLNDEDGRLLDTCFPCHKT